MELGISFFLHLFCHITLRASCNLWRKPHTGENHRLTQSHWQLSHMPRVGFKPGQWWKTASSQWQRLRPHRHQGRPLVRLYIIISLFYFQTWIHVYQTPVPHCRGVLHLRHLTIQKLIPVLEHVRWTPVDGITKGPKIWQFLVNLVCLGNLAM